LVDSLKALDPERPIREADIPRVKLIARRRSLDAAASGLKL
jgi:hypothetical protein